MKVLVTEEETPIEVIIKKPKRVLTQKAKTKMKDYYLKNKISILQKAKERRKINLKNPEWIRKRKEQDATYRKNNRDKIRILCKKYYAKVRLIVLSHYAPDLKCHGVNGGGCPFNCEDTRCLTIDHIKGGGTKHRKLIRMSLYQWLKHNNFPKGYQVLCMNCQFIKERN